MAPQPDPAALNALVALAERALRSRKGMVVLGLSGSQGSGKSTLAAALQQVMADRGIATATLSLDDLYHTRAERLRLAQQVHPLLATRGVPGTHDVRLGLATIAALRRGEPVRLPRFDKARDDRRAEADWDLAPVGTRLLLFEGWCLGSRPQPAAALAVAVNALEAVEDPDAVWRSYVNAALASDYAVLWSQVDTMAMLRAPDFATVTIWRQQQEAALRAMAGNWAAVMTDAQIIRFVAHYERITRHLLTDLPHRADLVIELDRDRHVTGLAYRAASSHSAD